MGEVAVALLLAVTVGIGGIVVDGMVVEAGALLVEPGADVGLTGVLLTGVDGMAEPVAVPLMVALASTASGSASSLAQPAVNTTMKDEACSQAARGRRTGTTARALDTRRNI